jgi:hypothetical protein
MFSNLLSEADFTKHRKGNSLLRCGRKIVPRTATKGIKPALFFTKCRLLNKKRACCGATILPRPMLSSKQITQQSC